NGYLRKGRKTKPKRQNRTRNGKAWKRQSQDKAQDGFKEAQLLSMAGIRALKSLTEETQERRAEDLALSINRRLYSMADMNIPADNVPTEHAPAVAPPARTDEQILPLSKAFTASSTIPAIYIHQFWDTMCFNSSTGLYSFQLDEQWFNLHKDILRDALNITPANGNNPFVAPPSSGTVIDYVNTLGYPRTLMNIFVMSVNALYQPWRAVLSMINMCLTGKNVGYDRPRHPTFLTDKKNLATDAHGKKKTTHLLIPNVRFTKLIIHHLRTKHNIHLRTGSPLHHSHDESILNTLKFVGKDGREIFGMLIPDALLTDKIKGAPYYGDYQEHVAKYQQFLDEECGKAVKEGATESSEATKVTKTKAAKATKPAGDKAPKTTATQPPKPKPAPTQPSKAVSEKKRKLVKEIPDEPSPAKRSKGGLVTKKRKPKSQLKLVDEPSNDGVPVEEPAYNEDDADLERALELSLMEQGAQTQGPARPVVIREPESGRIQPLPEINSSFRGVLLCPLNEGQDGPNPGEQDKGQAGPNPGTLDEGQAGSNPGDIAGSQPPPSHVVHAGPNLEHMDLKTTDASTQHKLEQMDKGFTKTAYPNVQENLKLPTEDQVILEEPPHEKNSGKTNAETEVQSMVSVPIHQDTSSVPPMTTPIINLTTMQSDSPLPTSTATTSIITTTTIPPTPKPQQSTTDSILVRRIENLDIPHKVSQVVDEIVIDAVDWAMQAPLRARFRDLPTVDMKEILQQRMFEDDSYKANNVHKDLYEALQKSLELDYSNQRLADQEEACTSGAPVLQEYRGLLSFCHLHLHLLVSDDQDSENDHTPAAADSRKDWWKPLPEEERLATPKPALTIPSSHNSDVENNWASALATTYEPPGENSLLA
ncbi:retrovirus-related pol polyprotein from transposon TNT 1-94, partial [Tanacetum coccineum]